MIPAIGPATIDLTTIDRDLVLSGLSLTLTAYFWLVKSRKERPSLDFVQLSDFRLTTRRHPSREGWKRLCVQQLGEGGVLAVNHSTRQNSITWFECFLATDHGLVRGDWGYAGDDRPPWNVGPESTIALSPAMFFDVPESFEPPDEPVFYADFATASGRTFSQRLTLAAPRLCVGRAGVADAESLADAA